MRQGGSAVSGMGRGQWSEAETCRAASRSCRILPRMIARALMTRTHVCTIVAARISSPVGPDLGAASSGASDEVGSEVGSEGWSVASWVACSEAG